MDEIKDAIRRVREHGNALKAGAPHQIAVGEDMLLICEAAERPAAIAPPSPLVAELQAKLAQADTLYRDLLTEHETLRAEHAALDKKYLELGTTILSDARRMEDHGDSPGDGVALVSASHEQFGTSIDEVVGNMQAQGIMGPNGEVLQPAQSTDLLGDKPSTKAERKARDKVKS